MATASVDHAGGLFQPFPRFLPSLYATPDVRGFSAALPSASTPSPYVANAKRRGREQQTKLPDPSPWEEDEEEEREEETGTDAEVACCSSLRSSSTRTLYYDAADDFLSGTESEVGLARAALLEEMERRAAAEEALRRVERRWERVCEGLAAVGLSIPRPPADGGMGEDEDDGAVARDVVVGRYVAEAMGRALGRAEAEAEAEEVVEAKEKEIDSLKARLRRATNQQMALIQQQQQALERSWEKREKRRARQKKWVLGSVVFLLSTSVGTSLIAYSCSHHLTGGPQLSSSIENPPATSMEVM